MRFPGLDGQPMGKVVRMYADSKYHNFKLYRVGRGERGLGSVDRTPPRGLRGMGQAADPVDGRADLRLAGQVPPPEQGPRRASCRRNHGIKLAMIQLMSHRLRPCDADAEFHYRDAA